MGKSLFASKTFWFNALALLVIVANGFGYANFQADPQLDKYASVAILLINLVLRLVTSKPVAFRAK